MVVAELALFVVEEEGVRIDAAESTRDLRRDRRGGPGREGVDHSGEDPGSDPLLGGGPGDKREGQGELVRHDRPRHVRLQREGDAVGRSAHRVKRPCTPSFFKKCHWC